MRKVLSFVLVLAMILGSVSMVFATQFTDTKGEDYAAAASLLSDLGVINGYADGTFGGSKNITRAEYVVMMVRALGYDVTGTAATGFKDVANDYWASAAINYAKTLGITRGYADGTFKPTANVTLDEAIAFTVRALGYKDEYLVGSYPANCINMAMNLGMLDGVKTGSVAATRGEVAQLVYNSLNEYVVAYFDKDGMPVYNAGTAATLLGRLGAQQVTRGGEAYYQVVDQDVLDNCADGLNLTEYVGQYVNLYYATKGASKDKYIGVYEVKGTTLTGKFSTNTAGTTYYFTTSDGVKYTMNIAQDAVYAANGDAVYYVNGGSWTTITFPGLAGNDVTYTVAAKVDGLQMVDLYSLGRWSATAEFAFEDGDFKADKLKLEAYKFEANNNNAIDTTAFALLGVNALSEIKEDDIVTVYTAAVHGDTYITKVAVSDKAVEGKVEKIVDKGEFYKDEYTIGGTVYKFSSKADATEVALVEAGDEGTFYLNYAGAIFDYETSSTAKYAVVLSVGDAENADTLNGVTAKVKLLLADGTTATYEFANKAEIEGVALDDGDVNNYTVSGDFAAGQAVSYTLNAKGKIDSIETVDKDFEVTDTTTAVGSKVTENGTINGTLISDKAVIFAFNGDPADAEDLADVDCYSVVTLANVAGAVADVDSFFALNKYGTAYEFGFVINPSTSTATFAVFNGYATVDDANYKYEVYLFVDGEAKTYKTNEAVNAYDYVSLYEAKFDANGAYVEKTVTPCAAPLTASVATPVAVSSNKRVVSVGDDKITVAEDVVVLIWNATKKVLEVSEVADLRDIDNKTIYYFDTEATAEKQDCVFDVVIAK